MEMTIALFKADYNSVQLSRIWMTANRLGFNIVDNNESQIIKYSLSGLNVSKFSSLSRRIKQVKSDWEDARKVALNN